MALISAPVRCHISRVLNDDAGVCQKTLKEQFSATMYKSAYVCVRLEQAGVCMCACVRACVGVGERERERVWVRAC